MSLLDRVQDLETAKRLIEIYEKENARLQKMLSDLMWKVARLEGRGEGEQLELEITKVREQLANLQNTVFGDSSEKRPRPTAEGEKKKQKGHGPKEQKQLPIEEWVASLPKDKQQCESCGGTLEAIEGMTEDSELIDSRLREFILVQLKRQKYRCKCGTMVTAPGPSKPKKGSRYSTNFAVGVAVSKYADHLPLERQCKIMKRECLDIDSQTLWDQIEALATHLQPTYSALRKYILGADVVGADETWWRLMARSSKKRWWAWGLTTPNACWYKIADSRSAETAKEILEGFEGTLLVDGYKAYETVANSKANIRLGHCWSHARRKFVEAAEHYPAQVEPALNLIGKLFTIEGEMKNPNALEGEEKKLAIEIRARQREKRSKAILDELKYWAQNQRERPKHAVRKAIEYMFSYWKGLTAFLDDPLLDIHNNASERGLRGMVLGRKNHFGSRSKRGTEVAAIFYSLIESAKLCDVDLHAYLLELCARAIKDPGFVLLPHDFKPSF